MISLLGKAHGDVVTLGLPSALVWAGEGTPSFCSRGQPWPEAELALQKEGKGVGRLVEQGSPLPGQSQLTGVTVERDWAQGDLLGSQPVG